MKIAGLDLSIAGSGIVVEELDDQFNIINVEYHAFTTKKKVPWTNVLCCRKDDFNNQYARYKFITDNIIDWCKDCEYIAVEDIATHGSGMIVDLSEFEGHVKMKLYDNGKKIRLYSPTTNKKFFSGRGSADKIGMREAFEAWPEKKVNIDDLPFVDKGTGIGPTSDIIDATALCEFLRFELKLKNGKMKLEDLTKAQQEVFTTTKTIDGKIIKESLINRPFIEP